MINRPCAPLNVLIVEDEALLAMDIEAMIEDSGHKVVGEAASLFDVEDLAADLCPDLAFVDIQLAKGTSGLDVCAVIRERWSKALVVFVTANPLKIPGRLCRWARCDPEALFTQWLALGDALH